MDKLNELISMVEAVNLSLNFNIAFIDQEVLGKIRKCCKMCGHCPDALLQELKEARAALLPQQRLKPSKGNDARGRSE